MAFASILEQTPSHLRRVRHIFISTQEPKPNPAIGRGPKLSNIDCRDAFEYEQITRQEKKTSAAIQHILRSIAPTVRTLAILFTYGWPFILLPVSLPNLTELIMRGPYYTPVTDQSLILFGSLRYLHIEERRHISSEDLWYISQAAPSLTHLRFTGTDSTDDLGAVSPTVTNVLIQIPSICPSCHCDPFYNRFLDNIQHLQRHILEQDDGKFTLLKASGGHERQVKGEVILRQWLERINGGQGCWIECGPQII